jgi:hypothetical protein
VRRTTAVRFRMHRDLPSRCHGARALTTSRAPTWLTPATIRRSAAERKEASRKRQFRLPHGYATGRNGVRHPWKRTRLRVASTARSHSGASGDHARGPCLPGCGPAALLDARSPPAGALLHRLLAATGGHHRAGAIRMPPRGSSKGVGARVSRDGHGLGATVVRARQPGHAAPGRHRLL